MDRFKIVRFLIVKCTMKRARMTTRTAYRHGRRLSSQCSLGPCLTSSSTKESGASGEHCLVFDFDSEDSFEVVLG